MTIIEILDGLAELGRLRLDRERAAELAQQATQSPVEGMPAQPDTVQDLDGDLAATDPTASTPLADGDQIMFMPSPASTTVAAQSDSAVHREVG